MKMIFGKGPKLNVAFVCEINKLQLEVIPIVKGKSIRIDLLIEGQQLQMTLILELARLVQSELLELSHVWVFQGGT